MALGDKPAQERGLLSFTGLIKGVLQFVKPGPGRPYPCGNHRVSDGFMLSSLQIRIDCWKVAFEPLLIIGVIALLLFRHFLFH